MEYFHISYQSHINMLKYRMDQNWLDSLHDIFRKYWNRNGSQPLREQKKTRPVYLRFFNTISFGLTIWEFTTFPDRRPCPSRRSDQRIGRVPTSIPCPLHSLDLTPAWAASAHHAS